MNKTVGIVEFEGNQVLAVILGGSAGGFLRLKLVDIITADVQDNVRTCKGEKLYDQVWSILVAQKN